MGRELKDVDIVRCVLWVRPSQNGIGGSVQNVFGVGTSQIRGKRDVERVVYRSVGGGRSERQARLGDGFRVLVQVVHGHAGPTHAEVWTHPLGPVAHVRQLIHGVREEAKAGQEVESSRFAMAGGREEKAASRGGNQQDETGGLKMQGVSIGAQIKKEKEKNPAGRNEEEEKKRNKSR